MAMWELCRIEYNYGRYSMSPRLEKIIAIVDTPKGETIIKESAEIGETETKEHAHSKLVGELLGEGWEPVHFDADWRARVFKRLIAKE